MPFRKRTEQNLPIFLQCLPLNWQYKSFSAFFTFFTAFQNFYMNVLFGKQKKIERQLFLFFLFSPCLDLTFLNRKLK